MHAVVTGGAGFIGSTLVRLLLDEGYEVTTLDVYSTGFRSNLEGLNLRRQIAGDVRDVSVAEDALDGADAIFHLAASVGNSRSISHPMVDATTNILGTLNVLEVARKKGIGKVVFSSSAGIFGELRELPIREDHPIEPDSPYGASKLGAEKLCLAYAKLYEIDAIALRYFNVYGVGQRFDAYGNVIPIFAQRILDGDAITIFGDGEQTRDFVNVLDVARANLAAARSVGVSGAFNIGSETAISINALARLMTKFAGTETPIVHGPVRPGDVRDSLADTSQARAQLGWQPREDLEAGVERYMAWATDSFGKPVL